MTMPAADAAPTTLLAHRKPHSGRATSHARGLPHGWLAVLLLGLLAACGKSAAGGDEEACKAQIEALRAAYVPIALHETGDKINAWNAARRELQEQLERGSPALGEMALRSFQAETAAPEEWRMGLLSVAAHCNPQASAALLEKLSLVYDGATPLSVRTEAMRLLCATSPAVAAELFEPIVLEQRPNVTYPPREQMLRHWILAARAVARPIDASLASIAVDIAQPAEARYVAVDELGKESQSNLGRKALETVLVESSSDGLLRRKAAQAMRSAMPRAEMCALLERVAQRESDPEFLNFLADLLIKNCP